jgi:5-methyltetrahydrofolate--homocysteine methyltransferase
VTTHTTRTTPRRRRPGGPGGSGGPEYEPDAVTPLATGPATQPGPALDRFRALVSGDRPVLADGAMGTMLFAAGLQSGEPPEVWNVAHPDLVRQVHRGYLDAGSRIILTNTFGGNRLRLGLHRLEDRVANLNRTAAILARAEVESAGVDALVAGDIGPSGEIMAPLGTLEREAAIEVFAEQAGALVGGGADVIWIETMSDLAEIEAAIAGVRRAAPGTPIIATMTFDTRGHTMMGVSPEQAAEALAALQVDALGGNCGNGPDELLPVVERMAAASPGLPIVAKSNVGMPVFVDARAVYLTAPAAMATEGLAMHRAGATIVGACCGSTPAHLAAMREALRPKV